MKRASFLKGAGALALAPVIGHAQGAWPDTQTFWRARWAST